MKLGVYLSVTILLLSSGIAVLADEPNDWQPDARTVAAYKKLCEQRRKNVLKWAQEDIKQQVANARAIKKTPISDRTRIDGVDRTYISFASKEERTKAWRKALADGAAAKEVVARFRDKNRPVWAATDSLKADEFTEINELLKLGMIFKMSNPKCRVLKVVDSDTAVVNVNWYQAYGGGEVELRTTKVLLRRHPTKGMTDGGVVELSQPFYVADSEGYGAETLFVLVPLDLELLYPSPGSAREGP